MKELSKQTVQIAISAIIVWQSYIEEGEGGKHHSPLFFRDTDLAKKELKASLERSDISANKQERKK